MLKCFLCDTDLDDVEADERLRHARPAAEVAAVVLGVPRLHAAHSVLDVLPDLVCTVTSSNTCTVFKHKAMKEVK